MLFLSVQLKHLNSDAERDSEHDEIQNFRIASLVDQILNNGVFGHIKWQSFEVVGKCFETPDVQDAQRLLQNICSAA